MLFGFCVVWLSLLNILKNNNKRGGVHMGGVYSPLKFRGRVIVNTLPFSISLVAEISP